VGVRALQVGEHHLAVQGVAMIAAGSTRHSFKSSRAHGQLEHRVSGRGLLECVDGCVGRKVECSS
jgi:hypothetical protein